MIDPSIPHATGTAALPTLHNWRVASVSRIRARWAPARTPVSYIVPDRDAAGADTHTPHTSAAHGHDTGGTIDHHTHIPLWYSHSDTGAAGARGARGPAPPRTAQAPHPQRTHRGPPPPFKIGAPRTGSGQRAAGTLHGHAPVSGSTLYGDSMILTECIFSQPAPGSVSSAYFRKLVHFSACGVQIFANTRRVCANFYRNEGPASNLSSSIN